jgi:hypothetical protein
LNARADDHVVIADLDAAVGADRLFVGVDLAGSVLDPTDALRHHGRFGPRACRCLHATAADKCPQGLVVVRVRGLDYRDIGQARPAKSRRQRDSRVSSADSNNLMADSFGHVLPPNVFVWPPIQTSHAPALIHTDDKKWVVMPDEPPQIDTGR